MALAVNLAAGLDRADHTHPLPQGLSRHARQGSRRAVSPDLQASMDALGGAIARAAQRLAVDGNDLAGDHGSDRGDRGPEGLHERLRLQQREKPTECVARRGVPG